MNEAERRIAIYEELRRKLFEKYGNDAIRHWDELEKQYKEACMNPPQEEKKNQKGNEQGEKQKKTTKQKKNGNRPKTPQEQIQDGKCELNTLSKSKNGEKDQKPFRTELTIERHPIFVVSSYNNDFFSYEREIIHPETGESVLQRILVGKISRSHKKSYGVLKQIHQHILYQLLKIWDELGYPLTSDPKLGDCGIIEISAYKLVMALRGSNSEVHYKRLQELLQDMQSIPITIENARAREGIKERVTFSLLHVFWDPCEIDPTTKRIKKESKSKVTILFSREITEGFLEKGVKKLLLGPYESMGVPGKRCRSETARLLYPIGDYELSRKTKYSITLVNAERRLGLKPQQYKSKRRERFFPATKMLNGAPIQGGTSVMLVKLAKTADEKDYKLEFERI